MTPLTLVIWPNQQLRLFTAGEGIEIARASMLECRIGKVLGSIKDCYNIDLRPENKPVLFYGKSSDPEYHEATAHAKKAYEFPGEDHPRLVR